MAEPPSDADLAALLDEERGVDAARSRSAERWIRQQALEEARLSGVLLSAVEQQETVTVRTTSGRSYTGAVDRLGADFVALSAGGGLLAYIALAAVTVVQSDRSLAPVPAGDGRDVVRTTTLQHVLAEYAGDRADVAFICAGQPESIPGQLVAVGVDVATITLDDRRRVGYVALSSVTEFLLRASG